MLENRRNKQIKGVIQMNKMKIKKKHSIQMVLRKVLLSRQNH